jgi:hypothetical protein
VVCLHFPFFGGGADIENCFEIYLLIIISNGKQSLLFKIRTNIDAIYFVVSLVNCLKGQLFCISVYVFVSDRVTG